MRILKYSAMLAAAAFSSVASAQQPVADAFRHFEVTEAKNLIAAAEEFAAAKYSYKPTEAQMRFGDIVAHLSGGDDIMRLNGTLPPTAKKK